MSLRIATFDPIRRYRHYHRVKKTRPHEVIRSSNVRPSQQQVTRQPPRQPPDWIHLRLSVSRPIPLLQVGVVVALPDRALVVVVTDVKYFQQDILGSILFLAGILVQRFSLDI